MPSCSPLCRPPKLRSIAGGLNRTKFVILSFLPFRCVLIMSRAQSMKIKMGQSIQGQRVTKVITRSDGGINVLVPPSKCSYPVLGIEVYIPLSLIVKMRRNERNTVCVSLRQFINGMQLRFMQKCWVKSVIEVFTSPTSTDFKRSVLAMMFAHYSHS